MKTSASQLCCHGLAEALGRRAGEGAGATFLLGVGEDGALFYKIGHTDRGQFTSAFGAQVVFCPFCGHGVGGEAARHASTAETNEEVTRWRLGETEEIETVVAALVARRAAAQIHLSE